MAKTILITGSSRGLGAATARKFANKEWSVAVNYRSDIAGADAVVKEIQFAGGTAISVQGDVTEQSDVHSLVLEVENKLGFIHSVVNNAVSPHEGIKFQDLKVSDFDKQYACSVRAPQLLLEATVENMKKHGEGRIVNIGSELQFQGNPDLAHYIAGKMGMHGLTRSWAKGLGAYGITVNMVCPGWTPVERHIGTENTQLEQAKLNPMGRLGSPEEVAETIFWLCSPAASYVSGQVIAINGANTIA